MRAEALTPVPIDTEGDVLRGRVRYLEHHGHESLAFLDIGATAVVVDEMAGTAPPNPSLQSGIRRLVGRLTGRAGTADPEAGGHTAMINDSPKERHKHDDSRV